MGADRCRIVLTDVNQVEVQEEMGYDFECTMSLLIDGHNVFRSLGVAGAKFTAVMATFEQILDETLLMVKNVDRGHREDDYRFWLLGTGYGFSFARRDKRLDIDLEVNSDSGPAVKGAPEKVPVGQISVRDWVETVVRFGKEVLGMLRRLNPAVFADITKMSLRVQELESWLVATDHR